MASRRSLLATVGVVLCVVAEFAWSRAPLGRTARVFGLVMATICAVALTVMGHMELGRARAGTRLMMATTFLLSVAMVLVLTLEFWFRGRHSRWPA